MGTQRRLARDLAELEAQRSGLQAAANQRIVAFLRLRDEALGELAPGPGLYLPPASASVMPVAALGPPAFQPVYGTRARSPVEWLPASSIIEEEDLPPSSTGSVSEELPRSHAGSVSEELAVSRGASVSEELPPASVSTPSSAPRKPARSAADQRAREVALREHYASRRSPSRSPAPLSPTVRSVSPSLHSGDLAGSTPEMVRKAHKLLLSGAGQHRLAEKERKQKVMRRELSSLLQKQAKLKEQARRLREEDQKLVDLAAQALQNQQAIRQQATKGGQPMRPRLTMPSTPPAVSVTSEPFEDDDTDIPSELPSELHLGSEIPEEVSVAGSVSGSIAEDLPSGSVSDAVSEHLPSGAVVSVASPEPASVHYSSDTFESDGEEVSSARPAQRPQLPRPAQLQPPAAIHDEPSTISESSGRELELAVDGLERQMHALKAELKRIETAERQARKQQLRSRKEQLETAITQLTTQLDTKRQQLASATAPDAAPPPAATPTAAKATPTTAKATPTVAKAPTATKAPPPTAAKPRAETIMLVADRILHDLLGAELTDSAPRNTPRRPAEPPTPPSVSEEVPSEQETSAELLVPVTPAAAPVPSPEPVPVATPPFKSPPRSPAERVAASEHWVDKKTKLPAEPAVRNRATPSTVIFTDAESICEFAAEVTEWFIDRGALAALLPLSWQEFKSHLQTQPPSAEQLTHQHLVFDCVNDILQDLYLEVSWFMTDGKEREKEKRERRRRRRGRRRRGRRRK